MSEQEKLDMDKLNEALLPICWEARINGKWVKGGRYYAWQRRAELVRGCLIAFSLGFFGYEAFEIIRYLMR